MNNELTKNMTVGSMVAEDFNRAQLFKRMGISSSTSSRSISLSRTTSSSRASSGWSSRELRKIIV